MIEKLTIRNLALLESADLELADGLSVFSGETGAGKSLLFQALDLVSGGRASKEVIRAGASSALVEAVFSAADRLLPPELQAALRADGLVEETEGAFPGELILSREVNAQGKHYCRVNGRLVSLQRLRELGAYLIEIQSQREQAALYDPARHLPLLDRYAGEDLQAALQDYQAKVARRRALLREQRELGGNPAQRARELDLLNYQIGEIGRLNPRPGEDAKLRASRDRMTAAVRVRGAAQEALAALGVGVEPGLDFSAAAASGLGAGPASYGGADGGEGAVTARLAYAESRLQVPAQADETWAALLERLGLLREELAAWAEAAAKAAAAAEAQPELLERVERRLDQLAELKRKYGPELEDVFRFKADCEARVAELAAAEARLGRIEAELEENGAALRAAADALSALRRAAAEALARGIEAELGELGMAQAAFQIAFDETPQGFGPAGRDRVQFLIRTNEGEAFKALAKIVSGGEASRVMLAIKLVLAADHPNATLVFDEVDAGVSGQTCALIARKLQRLALENQVLCVTHAVQLAACGRSHILIAKASAEGRTRTTLRRLEGEARRAELSRLLSGGQAEAASARVVEELLLWAEAGHERLAQGGQLGGQL